MSIINIYANDVWSEEDILSHGRAVISSQVSEARQNELRTIMLGKLAGMREATAEELSEILFVQSLTETQSEANKVARAEMAVLKEVFAYEADPTLVLSPEAQSVYDLRHYEQSIIPADTV